MGKRNVGIAGCGAIAEDHVRALKSIENLHIVALCDIDQETVSRRAKEWNVDHCYTNFPDMLDHEDISIVSILTPPQTHASMTIEAIHHGVNVLLEKPFTMSSTDAEMVLEALKGSTIKLTVDYNALLSATMMKALALVRKLAIGQVLGMEVKLFLTKDDPMASNEKHWCHKLPGGRFGEMLAHPVYLLQSVLGERLDVVKVLAEKRGSYDWMPQDELYVLLTNNRGMGRIYLSANAPRQVFLIDIYGTEKILNIDLLNGTLIILGHRTLSKSDSAIDCLSVAMELFLQTIQNIITYRHERGQDAFRRAYTSLVDSIEGKGEPLVNANMAYNTVKIVEEICRAM